MKMNREAIWEMSIDEIEQAVVKEVIGGELREGNLWIDGELMQEDFFPSIDMSDAWTVVHVMTLSIDGPRKAKNEFYNFLIHPDNQGFWDKSEEEAAFTICAYALIAVREAS